jgi:hypothetical protein
MIGVIEPELASRAPVPDAFDRRVTVICGTTPASVPLARLVEADVRRAGAATPESDALAGEGAAKTAASGIRASRPSIIGDSSRHVAS